MRSQNRLMRPLLPLLPVQQRNLTLPDGRPRLLSVEGDEACNLGSRRPGTLEAIMAPELLAATRQRPCFSDTRAGRVFLFTLSEEGMLSLEFALNPDGTVEPIGDDLLTIAPGDCTAARVGDFLIVRDAEGTLHYLMWQYSAGKYVAVGGVPVLPKPEVFVTDEYPLPGSVDAYRFPSAVSDLRAGVSDEIAAALIQRTRMAIDRAREDARQSGYWTAPVLVRYAVRLWDGTLLFLSAPVAVAPVPFAEPQRVQLPLVAADGKFTGTGTGSFSISAYRFGVTLDLSMLQQWRDVISTVEIWVSEDIATYDPTATGSVVSPSNVSSPSLWVRTPQLSESVLTTQLLSGGYECVATFDACAGNVELLLNRPAESVPTRTGHEAPAQPVVSAEAVCGHGGFLHLGGYRRRQPLPMMPQGEPTASQSARCSVTVRLSSLGVESTISAEGTVVADDGVITPLLWYPDRAATEITIRLTYPDGRLYEKCFSLSPLSEEQAAIFPTGTLKGVPLSRVQSLSEIPPQGAPRAAVTSLLTMARGNPFADNCATPYAGGYISHIEAQRSGGGAYTRQYIYLFTDAGIVALTHDMDGRHRNCRPISGRSVSFPKRVAAADTALFALADDGSLLAIRDASAVTLLRGMNPETILAADDRHGRLWLFPQQPERQTSLVIDTDSLAGEGVRASRSSFVALDVIPGSNTLLTLRRGHRPGERWWIEGGEDPDSPLEAEWLSPVVETERGGLSKILLGIEGDVGELQVDVLALSPFDPLDEGSGQLLKRFRINGKCAGMIAVPLMLPDTKACPKIRSNRIRLKLKGDIPALTAFGIEHVQTSAD